MEEKHTVEPPESKPNISPKLLPENYAMSLVFEVCIPQYLWLFM
jgi:hypothetical protein